MNSTINVLPQFADPEWIKNLLNIGTLEGVIKIMAIIGLVVYSLFALVIVKQTAIMTETFEAGGNTLVKLFAWLHFLLAIFLVAAVVVIW